VSYRRRPFWANPERFDGVADISQGYHNELDRRGELLAEVCRELLQPGALPALLHCAAGKDRTGIAVAVLLAALRVPTETIVEDYVLSRTCLGEPYLQEGREYALNHGWSWDEVAHLYDTPPERMHNTLVHLEQKWGGGEAYLRDHGVSDTELETLRGLLTEPG
jgi:protein-tyrosine phosphatase